MSLLLDEKERSQLLKWRRERTLLEANTWGKTKLGII
jgi:hypothetical protein